MANDLAREILAGRTRRHFLRDTALGLGGVALALFENPTASAATPAAADVDPFLPKVPHFAPRAKNVIFLSMSGGPPHLDLFDYSQSSCAATAKIARSRSPRGSSLPSPAARPSS